MGRCRALTRPAAAAEPWTSPQADADGGVQSRTTGRPARRSNDVPLVDSRLPLSCPYAARGLASRSRGVEQDAALDIPFDAGLLADRDVDAGGAGDPGDAF